jgi:hypothetical protein
MEDGRPFGRPRLVVDNPDRGGKPKTEPVEAVSSESVGPSALVGADDAGEPASREWCHLTVHCEWNDHTEWWVGQIFAGREVYRTGLFTNLAAAFAETISEFYRIVPGCSKPS